MVESGAGRMDVTTSERVLLNVATSFLVQNFVISGLGDRISDKKTGIVDRIDGFVSSRYANFLVDVGILGSASGRTSYALTSAASEELTSQGSRSIVAMTKHEWNQQALWRDIDATLRGHLRDQQQDNTLYALPNKLNDLLAAMLEVDLGLGRQLRGLNWPSTGRLWDVAGGHGQILAQILAANPHLSGSVVDLPGAEKLVSHSAIEHGVSIEFVGADLTELDFARGRSLQGDTFIFCRCLHNFGTSMRRALLDYATDSAEGRFNIVVVNPAWDWSNDGVRNPSVGVFNLYMCVNTVGGGVISQKEMYRELTSYGHVRRKEISKSLDLYLVSSDNVSWLDSATKMTSSIAAPAASSSEFEALVDGFIEAAVLRAVMNWNLDVYMAVERTVWQIEKFLGIPGDTVIAIMAGLTSFGYVTHYSETQFKWTANTILRPDPKHVESWSLLALVWDTLADGGAVTGLDRTNLDRLLQIVDNVRFR